MSKLSVPSFMPLNPVTGTPALPVRAAPVPAAPGSGPGGLVITPSQLAVLNAWHKAYPALFVQVLRSTPIPRRSAGLGDASTDLLTASPDDLSSSLLTDTSTTAAAAAPAASSDSTDWLSSLTSSLNTALSTYETAKVGAVPAGATTPAATASLLAKYGVTTTTGSLGTLGILALVGGGIYLFMRRRRARK